MEDMEHSLEGVRAAIAESGKRSEELKARYVHCGKIEKVTITPNNELLIILLLLNHNIDVDQIDFYCISRISESV